MTIDVESNAPGAIDREELLALLLEDEGFQAAVAPPIERRTEEGPAPLSFAQQRLWFLHRLTPSGSAYNVAATVRLRGPLDRGALLASLGHLVERHEVLRSRFEEIDGKAVQVAVDGARPEFREVDLRALEEPGRQAAASRLLAGGVRRPFDLTDGTPVRFLLLRLGDDRYLLQSAAHHIVCDGWSMGILTREMTELYPAYAAGRRPRLPALPLQYSDVAAWQRRHLDEATLASHLEYWRRQLAGRLPVLDLPTDRPRPASLSYRGASCGRRLGRPLVDRLIEAGRRDGNTLFMTLLAAFDVLLHRWSGQDDLLVGTPVANRDRPELEGLIGFFVNSLVLRCRIDGDPTFRQLAARVRETTLEAFVHADLPFERLVEELQPPRSAERHPLFQALFVLQNAPLELPRLGEVEVERVPVAEHASKFDLSLKAEEGDDGLELKLEYNTDLFNTATAERMLAHLTALLEAVAADPERPISELPLGREDGEGRAVVVGEKIPSRSLVPVHHRFATVARQSPGACAVITPGERLSYGELDRRSNRLARYLASLEVAPERPVGICLEASAEMVIAVLAALKAGGAYLPLDPAAPPDRLAATLDAAGAAVLLTGASVVESLPFSFLGTVVDLGTAWPDVERESDAPFDGGADLDHLAYLISTSGSTGRPKQVAVAHRHLAAYVAAAQRRLPLHDSATFAVLSTFAADLGNTVVFPSLCSGAALLVPPREVAMDPERLAALLRREPVDCCKLTPTHLRLLLTAAEPAAVLPRRCLVLGGERLSWELADRVRELAPECRVFNHYGPSETTVGVAAGPVEESVAARCSGSVPVGRPMVNCSLVLLDRRRRPVPPGVPGELCVGGDQVTRGYAGAPALTAAAFVPDPFTGIPGGRLYRTGDLARRLPGGELEILGRVDRQVKVRGHRVELAELESVLGRQAAVAQAAVAAFDGSEGDVILVAYVVPEEGARVDGGALASDLAAELPPHMVPGRVMICDSLPLTANGKVDYRALPQPEPQRGRGAPVATPLEETVAEVWRQVLGAEQVGRDDDFFDLGGHSVLATQVMSRIQAIFGVELPLLGLFESPTVAGLARLVELHVGGGRQAGVPPLVPVPRDGDLPLSFAQERMWFLHCMEPSSAAYNMPAVLRVEGPLDVGALESALRAVLRRHEGLRSSFSKVEGRPVLRICPVPPRLLACVDLSALPAQRRETVADRLLRDEGRRPFDLSRGPLLRARLVRLDDGEHRLLLNTHHVVSDGWSVSVVIRELGELYRSLLAGTAPELPELPVQYVDFAAWQRRWLSGDVLDEQISWWREQLGDDPAPMELPTDRPYPTLQTYRGGRVDIRLSPQLSDGLRELARRHDVTLFMLLLAAFQVFLSRYSGQRHVSVGTPVAGRNRSELELLVGLFVNTLVMRVDLAGDPTVGELLDRVRTTTLGAYAHQDLPFERLVEALQPDRDLGRSPLFQVMFVWQNIPILPFELSGLRLTPLGSDTEAAKFELTLSLQESARGIFGTLEYNADLFDRYTVDRMVGHLATLLDSLVAHPERRISELDLLTAEEHRHLLEVWNRAEDPAAARTSLLGAFSEQVARVPQRTAVSCAGRSLTYHELDRASAAAAHRLAALGVGTDVVVAIAGRRGVELVSTTLGVLRAGGAYLPLDPGYPRRRIADLLARSEAPLLLVDEAVEEGLAGALEELDRVPRIVGWKELSSADAPTAPVSLEDPSQLAYVIYTSGSTGRPKGAMVQLSGMVNHLQAKIADLALGPADVVAQTASQSFDISVWQMFAPLLVGGRVEVFDDEITRDPVRLLGEVERAGVTVLEVVPSLLGAALAALDAAAGETPRLDELRWLLVTGEAVPPQVCRDWLRRYPATPMMNAYGPSECSDDVTHHVIDRPPALRAARVPIGSPIANTRLYPLDASGRPVPVGVPGELHAGGLGVGRGYLDAPARTAERFVPDPFGRPGSRLYRTGDLVRLRSDGTLDFLGRIDHQVKVRGFRIELGEVEAVLLRHPQVREAVVTAQADGYGRRLVAYVGAAGDPAPRPGELRASLAEQLPDHMVPSVVMVLDRLPLNPNGKVDRGALPKPEVDAGAGGRVAPRNLLEHRLCALWSEALDVAEVGITDDFFALGGHSLLAVRLMALVQERLARELPISSLFQGPTVEHMAHLLRQSPDPTLWSPLVAIRTEGSRRPLFCVHPTGGDVLCYQPLPALLGPEQPLYALQARGLDGEEEPIRDLEEMARQYRLSLRDAGHRGPWRLGGWSFGGVVAYEMARQLRAAGEAVELVAVFDSLAPTAEGEIGEQGELSAGQWAAWFRVIGGEFERVFDQELDLPVEEMGGLDPERQLEVFLAALGRVEFLPPGSGRAVARGFWRVHEANTVALWNYARTSPRYGGPVTLFRSEESLILDESWSRDSHAGDTLGWDRLVDGELTVHHVTGDHNTLFRSPNVEVLARYLSPHLERGAGGAPTREEGEVR